MEAADTQPVVNWMMANFGLCQQPSWSIVLVNLQAVKQTEGTERLGEGRVVSALASIQGLSLSAAWTSRGQSVNFHSHSQRQRETNAKPLLVCTKKNFFSLTKMRISADLGRSPKSSHLSPTVAAATSVLAVGYTRM